MSSDPRIDSDFLRRVPPHNEDAERSVLGAVLIDNRQFDAVAEILETDDFYRETHRITWTAISAIAAAKQPIDLVTLGESLRPQLEAIGGAGYLADLVAFVPSPSMATHYAKIVRDKSNLRKLAILGGEIAGKSYEAPEPWSPDYVEEQLALAEHGIAGIACRAIHKPEAKKAETLSAVLWRLEHGVDDSVRTGFDALDRSFGGFNTGHLTMLAARTSKGKTAFATNIAINTARAGLPTAFFTLEMTSGEMWLRALGCLAQVDMFRVRRRGYRDGERERVADAEKLLGKIPLEILYRPSMRPRDLRLECRRLAREMGGLKLVVVDYFNLMRGDRRERERWREMQEAILSLKGIAGELGIPLLLLSQLNRETNENEPPSLSNLRDTGAAEEHASNVLFVWQKPSPTETAPAYDDWEDINVIIAKQRNGPAGLRVPMAFKKKLGRLRGEVMMMLKLIGMATPFDIPTYRPVEPRKGGEAVCEQFANGCFDRTLRPGAARRNLIFASWNHDQQVKFGSIGQGSLRLFSDADGLHIDLDVADEMSPFAKAVSNHCVSGLSVGFHYCDYFYERIKGAKVRVITEAQLDHVSILAYPHLPAFPGTWIRIAESPRTFERRAAYAPQRGAIPTLRRQIELEAAR